MASTLSIKVIPNSSVNQVVGYVGDLLKVKVMVAPEKGKANKAVVKVLAAALSIPASHVSVATGQTNSLKTLSIEGLTDQELDLALSQYR
ncbi:DUF167 domain-containing protein [Arenicella xantha]|uniref:UPF0235 protein DFR28_104316 n=1 Tax=Arenicella xantha TaxID=644221 RepID=A0A395JHS7_9GAMM|nr:DUF167 domain-containing protein [Arenicella xantha]RBP49385.1 hypothetical protein DFR28_104316 [Arenicella xantha]